MDWANVTPGELMDALREVSVRPPLHDPTPWRPVRVLCLWVPCGCVVECGAVQLYIVVWNDGMDKGFEYL